MGRAVIKMTLRSIRSFFGWYMALFSIILISVAFFSGLKVTKDAMVHAGDRYFKNKNFYDFRMISTLGFLDENVDEFAVMPEISSAEGVMALEAEAEYEGEENTYQFLSIPERINLCTLTAGRMPEKENECLADDSSFTESDIGKNILLTDSNKADVMDLFEVEEYTIVGLAKSPLYISSNLSSGSTGGGSLQGFLYLLLDGFSSDAYTELYVTLKETAYLYSDAYQAQVDKMEPELSEALKEMAERRFEEILEEEGLTRELADQLGIELEEPETYLLGRTENAGYVSFENDTSIVSGIANVFPVFFILVAMLVCITTMTRMIEEERTQIGVLKALGFSGSAITAKYMLYAVSATALGWGVGFFLGTWGIPQILWVAYRTIYDFTSLPYLFDPVLAALTLLVALAGTMGSTWYSCHKELYEVPATLLRPRTPKAGKRVLLEYITFLWRRLPFLQKVSLRNMLLYKKRFVMMIVGISGCTALLVTGFGAKDSIVSVGEEQYVRTQKYNMEAAFSSGEIKEVQEELDQSEYVDRYLFYSSEDIDVRLQDEIRSVQLLVFSQDNLSDYWDLRGIDDTASYMEEGNAFISSQAATMLGAVEGSVIELRLSEKETGQVVVAGIFENYINNYIFLSRQTYENLFGEWEATAACIYSKEDEAEAARQLRDSASISRVSLLSDSLQTIEESLACLNYVVALLIVFAGILAFIVIYNLTNINLSERTREIATVKVLGFYSKETDSYILRENLIMSALAGMVGIPVGIALHRFVMNQIAVDGLNFLIYIAKGHYVIAFLMTILFALLINLYMHRQIEKIPMAESLKTVE